MNRKTFRWLRPIVSALFAGLVWKATAMEPGLIAEFKFDGNGRDSASLNDPLELKNTEFKNGSLYLNGRYEGSALPNAFRATAVIPNLSYHSLTISLDFLPLDFSPEKQFSNLPWLNVATFGWWDRLHDNTHSDHAPILTAGQSCRWLGYRVLNGELQLNLNNLEFTNVFRGAVVEPGRWHNLMCSFELQSGRILTFLDGLPLATVQLTNGFKLSVLQPEFIEYLESDKSVSFQNYGNGSAFHGYVDNLKVFGKALGAQELKDIYSAGWKERPSWSLNNGTKWLPAIPLALLAIATAIKLKAKKSV